MTHCRYFYTTRKGNHSATLTPRVVGRRRPFPSEICVQSDPPPFEKSRLRQISLSCGIKISAVRHLVLSQSTRVTDGQTDRITTPKTALAYARVVKTKQQLEITNNLHKTKSKKVKPGLAIFMPYGQKMDQSYSTAPKASQCIHGVAHSCQTSTLPWFHILLLL